MQQPLAVADIAWHPALAYIAPQVETVKSRQLSGRAYLDFPVNKTEIYPDYRRNPAELAKIRATIDSVRADKDVNIVQIYVNMLRPKALTVRMHVWQKAVPRH